MIQSGNKRIALNTAIIYIRLAVVSIIGLFTSRYVLQTLGVSDYGLYNVVGSVIAMLNVVSIALHSTTRRFINTEMGRPDGNLNKVFNICLNVHILFSLVFFVVIQWGGSYYIDNFMNVAPDKVDDAHFVLLISNIVAAVGLINVPYQGLLNAFEKFGQMALIDILVAVIKAGVVICLVYYEGNALRFFAVANSFLTAVSFFCYQYVCYRDHRAIICYHWYSDKSLYRDIVVFNNYTAIGATTFLARTQGASILVNFFFGTIVNGAFAIAYQVENYVMLFVNNLGTASAPQITQNYSSGNVEKAFTLCSQINRFTVLLTTVVFFTLFIELDAVLTLWLKKVPEGALLYTQLILIYLLIRSFPACLATYIHATGKIKWFQIIGGCLEIGILPVVYVLFSQGLPAETIIYTFMFFCFLSMANSFYLLYRILSFDIKRFFKESYFPSLCVIGILVLWCITYQHYSIFCFISSIGGILLTGIFSTIVAYYVGLKKIERERIIVFVKSKF